MHDDRWSDTELLAELGEALRAEREVPGDLVDSGRALFTWRSVDAELAALARARLTYDSFADDTALPTDQGGLLAVRSETASLRSMTFATEQLSIELEVTDTAVLGQLVPPQPAVVEVVTPDQQRIPVEVDDVGWFVVRPLPTTRFRLTCRTTDGMHVVTDWITL